MPTWCLFTHPATESMWLNSLASQIGPGFVGQADVEVGLIWRVSAREV